MKSSYIHDIYTCTYIVSNARFVIGMVKAPYLLNPQEISRHKPPLVQERCCMHPDFSHWGVLVGTHILRSFWDDWGQQALKGEITTLRVEVHRAKELVADYNYVLETCERD